MTLKRISLCCIACTLILLFSSGCGDQSELKSELKNVSLSYELPPISNEGASRLMEIDDDVYEQQIAACEMYYEAYQITNSADFIEKYKDDVNDKRVAFYCNKRRQELQLDIATQLNDNVYVLAKSVEDCGNIAAYLKRINYDVENFYDYYADVIYSDDTEEALCRLLITFYEKSNILAFGFMDENKDRFIEAAIDRIKKNSYADDSFNMYIKENNELIKSLNAVYGGVPSYAADEITAANIALARKLLESDNDLPSEAIDKLMMQLGEPTPTPVATETPTPEPTEAQATERPTQTPPQRTPAPTSAPAQRPVTQNVPQNVPQNNTPVPATTPKVYYFDVE